MVDDDSQDNTAEVVAQLAADARLHYLPKTNEERGKARNYGLARAWGEYVLFRDSDDLLHPNHLATLHTHIQVQARPNFIVTKYNFNRNGHLSDNDLAPLPAGQYGVDLFMKGNRWLATSACGAKTLACTPSRKTAATPPWRIGCLCSKTRSRILYTSSTP